MPDDRFTQTTLDAPRADQSEAIATYKSGAHLLNYAYSGRHSGVATIDALLPEQDGFSVWNTTAAGTIIPFSFMDASLRYFDTDSYANTSDPTTRGVYESDILELSEDQKNAIRMGLSEWARYIDVEFVEVTEGNDGRPFAFWWHKLCKRIRLRMGLLSQLVLCSGWGYMVQPEHDARKQLVTRNI